MRIDQHVSDKSVDGMRQGLRRAMKEIKTYHDNFEVGAKDARHYKKAARHLSKMMLSLNKVVFLKKQQEILESVRDLYSTVGLSEKSVQRKWDSNHAQLLRERDALNKHEQEWWLMSA